MFRNVPGGKSAVCRRGGLPPPGRGQPPYARAWRLEQAGADYRQTPRSRVARHPVSPPLVAYPVRGVHVRVIERVAPTGHRHDLVNLEAPRVAGRQAVVDWLAADVTRPSLRPEPCAQLPARVAVPAPRVSHSYHLEANCFLVMRKPPAGGFQIRAVRSLL